MHTVCSPHLPTQSLRSLPSSLSTVWNMRWASDCSEIRFLLQRIQLEFQLFPFIFGVGQNVTFYASPAGRKFLVLLLLLLLSLLLFFVCFLLSHSNQLSSPATLLPFQSFQNIEKQNNNNNNNKNNKQTCVMNSHNRLFNTLCCALSLSLRFTRR